MARVITIVVRLDEYLMHVSLCGHFRCTLLLAQARPRMMQHLSSYIITALVVMGEVVMSELVMG